MRLLLLFLSSLAAVAAFSPPNCGLGYTSRARRVANGTAIPSAFQPWVVSIYGGHCTGSLISDRHVLTAAHCIMSPSKGCTLDQQYINAMIIYVGLSNAFNTSDLKSTHKVKSIALFDSYLENMCRWRRDIAVLELTEPVEDAVPVCLPIPENGELFYNSSTPQPLFVTGYSPNGGGELPLLRSGMTSLPYSCKNPRICTKKDRASTLAGDSGGPWTEIHSGRHVLVGGTTAGNNNLQQALEVAYFLDEILEFMSGKQPA